jgi:hypothetical protein
MNREHQLPVRPRRKYRRLVTTTVRAPTSNATSPTATLDEGARPVSGREINGDVVVGVVVAFVVFGVAGTVVAGTVVVAGATVEVVVEGAAEIVTTVDPWFATPNMSVVRFDPPVTENVDASVRLEVTAPEPGRALDVTKIVHVRPFVCSIRSIESTPTTSKSTPIVVESVVQSRAELAPRVRGLAKLPLC